MPAAKVTGGGSKKVPAPAVKAEKAEAKITPVIAKAKVDAAKAVALKATKEDDKKAVKDAKIAAGKVVGSSPTITSPTTIPTPTITADTKKTDTKTGGGPAGDGNTSGGSSGSQEDFNKLNPIMDVIPAPVIISTPEINITRNATRNVTDISSLVPQYNAEEIQKILFENLSAIELSKVERHDTIEGIDQKYSIISNLSEIRKKYDIIKQLTIMDKFKPLTSVYTINIQDKIPQEDYIILESLDSTYQYIDENNQVVTREKGYYYIDSNGDLVIELINLERNQQVEVLIDTNGTIYKVES